MLHESFHFLDEAFERKAVRKVGWDSIWSAPRNCATRCGLGGGADGDHPGDKPKTPDSRQTRRICIRDQIVEEEGYKSRKDAVGKSRAR